MKIVIRIIVIVGISVVILSAFYFSEYIYDKSQSENIASGKVQQYCKEHGYDLSKLRGPEFSHTLGIPVWAGNGTDIHPAVYSWNYFDKDSNTYLALVVWFDDSYGSHLIVWDMHHW